MPNDEKVVVTKDKLTAIGDKIRETQGTQETYTLDQVPDYIGGEPNLQQKTVTPTTSQQNVTPDSGYDGLSKVVVNAAPLQTRYVTPSTSQQTINPTGSNIGLEKVVVYGANVGTKEVSPQVADYPGQVDLYQASSDGYLGYNNVRVRRVENVEAQNIKKDVSILGVTGTYEGEGGIVEVNALPQSGDADKIYRLISNFDLEELSTVLPNNLTEFMTALVSYGPTQEYVYIIGGFNDSTREPVNTIYRYDIHNKVLELSSVTLPVYLNGCATIYSSYYGRIYLFGGETKRDYDWIANSQIYYIEYPYGDIDDINIGTTSFSGTFNYKNALAIELHQDIYLVGGEHIDWDPSTGMPIWQFNDEVIKWTPENYSIDRYHVNVSISRMKVVGQWNYWSLGETYSFILAGAVIPSEPDFTTSNYTYILTISANDTVSLVENSSMTMPEELNGIGGFPYGTNNPSNPDDIIGYMLGGYTSETISDKIYAIPYGPNISIYQFGTLSEPLYGMEICREIILGGKTTNNVASNKIYKINTEGTYKGDFVYRNNKWYNLNELGIIQVEQLPTVGNEERIYETVENNLTDLTETLPEALVRGRNGPYQIGSVQFGNDIYIFGGENSSGINRNIYKYNIINKTITNVASISHPQMISAFAVINTFIYLYSSNYICVFDTTIDALNDEILYSLTDDMVYASAYEGNYLYLIDSYSDGMSSPQCRLCIYDITSPTEPIHIASCPLKYHSESTNMNYDIIDINLCDLFVENQIVTICNVNGYGDNDPISNYIWNEDVSEIIASHMGTTLIGYNKLNLNYSIKYALALKLADDIYYFGGYKGEASEATFLSNIYKYNLLDNSFKKLSISLSQSKSNLFGTVSNNTLYIMGGLSEDTQTHTRIYYDTITTFTQQVLAKYVYDNNQWVEIGSGGSINIRPVTDLTARETVISWTAADVHELVDYNPIVSYIIKVNGTQVGETSNTSFDLSTYISGSATVEVLTKVALTGAEGATIEISPSATIIVEYLNSISVEHIDASGKLCNNPDCGAGIINIGSNSAYIIRNTGQYSMPYSYSSALSDLTDATVISSFRLPYPQVLITYSTLKGANISSGMTPISWMELDTDPRYIGYSAVSLGRPLGDCIAYVFGGESSDRQTISDACYKINLSNSPIIKTDLPNLPQGGVAGACAFISNDFRYIYIIGGRINNNYDLNRVIKRFDVINEVFDSEYSVTVPSNISLATASQFGFKSGNKAYIIGGDNLTQTVKLYELDLKTGTFDTEGKTFSGVNLERFSQATTQPFYDGIYHTNMLMVMDEDEEHRDICKMYRLYPEKIPYILTHEINNFEYMIDSYNCVGSGIIGNTLYLINPYSQDSYMSSNKIIGVNLETNAVTVLYSFTLGFSISNGGTCCFDNEGGYIYFQQGVDGKTLFRFNTADNTLISLGQIPLVGSSYTGLVKSTIVKCNNSIYIFGGYTYDGSSYSETNQAFCYNEATDSFYSLTNMSSSFAEAIGIVYDNSITLFGGRTRTSSDNGIYIFDCTNETWSTLNIPNLLSIVVDQYSSSPNSTGGTSNIVYKLGNNIYIRALRSEGLTLLYKYIPAYNYVASETELYGTQENPYPDLTRLNDDTVEINVLYSEIMQSSGNDLYIIYRELVETSTKLVIKKYSK